MPSNVYANGREVSGKAADNKSVAAMPDVCLSPPTPPAGPVPIPYPNFSQASDTDSGTRTVQVGGSEAGIKNESTYKTSNGDEAATQTLGMGVMTGGIQGPSQHGAWSFDVQFEGSNAIRFMDLTTHNHSNPGNTSAITSNLGTPFQAVPKKATCQELRDQNGEARDNAPPPAKYKLKTKNTLTTAQYSPPGGGNFNVKAFSKKIKGPGSSGWSKGVKKRSGLCSPHKYGGGYQPASAHTEARIVEDIFKATNKAGVTGNLGTLTLNIRWQQEDGGLCTKPCAACKKMLCKAQECGLKIRLCSNTGDKPKPLECDE